MLHPARSGVRAAPLASVISSGFGGGRSAMTTEKKPNSWLRHFPRLPFLIPFLAVLWVPSYNRIEPKLGGVPFFYWYQLAWILLGSAIVLLVYAIDRKIARTPKGPKGKMDTTGVPGDIL
jgi:hypothetical protein